MEKLYLLNKLELAKNILNIPSDIEKIILRVNDLRNGLAHAFFPENLKRNKPTYNGVNIRTLEGLKKYKEDTKRVFSYFVEKIFKIKL